MPNQSDLEKQLLGMDLYKLLEVEETSSLDEIKKAYRKRALELHPDKNLDKKEEAEKNFIQLQGAFKILSDKSARAAYDAVRFAKREKAKRDEQLDDKRRKLKQDLERREQQAREKVELIQKSKVEERLQKEIERLRREGNKLLEEETELINEQIRKSKIEVEKKPSVGGARLKITWPKSTANEMTEDLLRFMFAKYGQIDILVVSKKTSAILEYKTLAEGKACLRDEEELNKRYGISLKLMNNGPEQQQPEQQPETKETSIPSSAPTTELNFDNFDDFEAQVLKKLKSANS